MKRGWWLIVLVFAVVTGRAAEVIPPPPEHYFNDYAHAVSPAVAAKLNQQLEAFEKSTSNQLVVAIFPKMQTDSSLEDFAQRIFEAWKPGNAKLDNGAILFVFVQDHKMRIHTGYGLEGALPDAICKRIISDEIAPRLKAGDFDGGMTAGVSAMMAAARGEYKGTGATVRHQSASPAGLGWIVPLIFIVMILITISRGRGTAFGARGRRRYGGFYPIGWSGGGGSSWGGGSSGGGGFSGGGGSSGGGGASGSW